MLRTGTKPKVVVKHCDIGVIHGRFQPFHNGHLEYALEAKQYCRHLIVGITNPDPSQTKTDSTNHKRSELANNPWTYYERLQMVERSLLGEGLTRNEFTVVPFPINFPERIQHYVPQNATHFTRIFEEWNVRKIELLKQQGFKVIVLKEATPDQKRYEYMLPVGGIGKPSTRRVVEGTEIRRLLREGKEWEVYVPAGTVNVVHKLPHRKSAQPVQSSRFK